MVFFLEHQNLYLYLYLDVSKHQEYNQTLYNGLSNNLKLENSSSCKRNLFLEIPDSNVQGAGEGVCV